MEEEKPDFSEITIPTHLNVFALHWISSWDGYSSDIPMICEVYQFTLQEYQAVRLYVFVASIFFARLVAQHIWLCGAIKFQGDSLI